MRVYITVKGADVTSAALRRGITPGLQRASIRTGTEMMTFLKKEPGRVKYPIRWKSMKQKRFYFAMRRELEQGRVSRGNASRAAKGIRGRLRMRKASKFIPYQRKLDPTSEWVANFWNVTPYGGIGAKVANDSSYAPFVQGDRQQPFHADTGWRTASQAVDYMGARRRMGNIYVEEIKNALRASGLLVK